MEEILGPFSGNYILSHLSDLLINKNCDALISSTPLILSSKLSDCDTAKFWDIICSMEFLETFPEGRYRVLYDLSQALCKISKPQQITDTILKYCEVFRIVVDSENYQHALFVSEIILKLITEVEYLPELDIIRSKILELGSWNHKNNKYTSMIFKNLTISHGTLELETNQAPVVFINKIINLLDPEVMVSTLCSLNVFLFEVVDGSIIRLVYESVTFWEKIIIALQSPSETLSRKKTLFLIQIILSYLKSNKLETSCTNTKSGQLFNYRVGLEDMWEDLLLINETLEQTQSHIIRPIFSLIPKVCDFIQQGDLGMCWLALIFCRILNQESKMVARWGVQLLLELDHKLFLGKNIQYLYQILFPALEKTSMFYRPNFLKKGSYPPILKNLMSFLKNITASLPDDELDIFITKYLTFFNQHKIGSVPLVMMSYVLSNLEMKPVLSTHHLEMMIKVHRSVIHTHPHVVKGAVQCFFTTSIIKYLRFEKNLIRTIIDFLGSLYLEYTLSLDVYMWQQLKDIVGGFVMKHIDYFFSLVKGLFIKTDGRVSTLSVKGVGIMIMFLCEVDPELQNELFNIITHPLICCGENLYLPEYHIFISSELINTMNFLIRAQGSSAPHTVSFNEPHPISKKLTTYSELIIESCLQFITRYIFNCLKGNLKLPEGHETQCFKKMFTQISSLGETIVYFDEIQQTNSGRRLSPVSDVVKADMGSLSKLSCDLSSLSSDETDCYVTTVIKMSTLIQHMCWTLEDIDLTDNMNMFLSVSAPSDLSKTYSSDVFHHFLESSWVCVSMACAGTFNDGLVRKSTPLIYLFKRAVEDIQKMKDSNLVVKILMLIQGLLEVVIEEDITVFSDALKGLWVCVEDFESSAAYWKILEAFCDFAFHQSVLANPLCVDIVEKWMSKLEMLGSEKEGAMFFLCQALTRFSCISKETTFWDYSHFYITKLSLYGISQTREKKNGDDLIAFIRNLGDGCPVNTIYPETNRHAGKVRAMAATFLLDAVNGNTAFCENVVDTLMDINNSYIKGYLMNSTPNRLKIRLWQTILLMIPQITKTSNLKPTFIQMLECLRNDEQPSVRCYIEWCCCLVILEKRDFINLIWEYLDDFTTRSSSLLSSLFSITHHTVSGFSYTNKLSEQFLNTAMEKITVWTNCQSHSVRNYAAASIVKLEMFYHKNNFTLPQKFSNQVRFLMNNVNVSKLLTRIEANNYFSRFNVVKDCCLRTIFTTLPAQFCILENEWISEEYFSNHGQNYQDKSACLWMPKLSGDFHLLKYPVSHEEDSYLISFKDLQSLSNIQKKITPWQIMATNLGIELDRRGNKKGELVVFASLIEKAPNLGGLSRTCEIFGVKTMAIGNFEFIQNREFKSLSMTSEKWVMFDEVLPENSTEYFLCKKREGYTIVGVEQTAKSVSLENFAFPEKSVLVLGRERDGIPVNLIDEIDVCVEIPQFGLIRSLNVHVSASIIIWEYAKQHNLIKGKL